MIAGIEREGLFAASCPESATGPSVTVGWRSVGFVHWSYDPDAVTRLLPPTVAVDLYGGRAWAGYQFLTVTPGPVRHDRNPPRDRRRWRPRLGLRPDIVEVRAVVPVVDRMGRPGQWYLSVDTNRRLVAAWLRRWLNVSAYEAETRFSTAGDRLEYSTRRPDGTTARLKLSVGPEVAPTDVERFLTARWRLVLPPRWWDAPDQIHAITTIHDPWILHRASLEFFDDEVLVAAGLPPAIGPGQALWSPGTTVRLGRPQQEA